MKANKIKIALMIIGGSIGLAFCFFDAMLSYSDTAGAEYSGFKMDIPRYDVFLIRAVVFTLAGVILGWGINKTIKWLFFFMAIPVLSMAQSTDQGQLPDFRLPATATIVRQATGDLDKDGIDENVYIYDIAGGGQENLGASRMLSISKTIQGKQRLFYKVTIDKIDNVHSPRNKSIDSLYILRNCIVIAQEEFSGGRNAIEYIHRIRFQNGDWYLIGSKTSLIRNCIGATAYDVNFSTGAIEIKFTPDGGCDDEPAYYAEYKKKRNLYKHKFAKIPLLRGLNLGGNTFTINGTKVKCYY